MKRSYFRHLRGPEEWGIETNETMRMAEVRQEEELGEIWQVSKQGATRIKTEHSTAWPATKPQTRSMPFIFLKAFFPLFVQLHISCSNWGSSGVKPAIPQVCVHVERGSVRHTQSTRLTTLLGGQSLCPCWLVIEVYMWERWRGRQTL